ERWLSARQRYGYEIDQRVRRYEETRVAGVDVELSPRTHIDVTAQRSRLEFDHQPNGFADPFVAQLDDYTSHGVAVALTHELTSLTSVAMTVTRNNDRFAVARWRDGTSLGMDPALEFKPFALINGKASVGWARYKL